MIRKHLPVADRPEVEAGSGRLFTLVGRYRPRVAATLGAVVLSLSSAQCARDGPPGTDEGDRTLTVHLPGDDERALGPGGAGWIWPLVFLEMVRMDEETGDIEPRLLDRWEQTPDFKEYTVHVRENLRWDDGVPVTAEDVKFSIELWTGPEVWYENRFHDEITVVDSLTLHVTIKDEFLSKGIFLVYSWLPMLPKHRLDELDPADIHDWPFWIQPVGNGPYRYKRHVARTLTELEANPDYFGPEPRIPNIILQYGGNSVTELMSGNVDYTRQVTPLQAAGLVDDPRFRLYHTIQLSQQIAIRWNHRSPLFDDVAVRRALTMSIDRRELNRLLHYPEDLPVVDVPARDRQFFYADLPAPLPFDLERAAELLANAGWVDSNADGTLDKEGLEFRFTLGTSPAEATEAVFIQQQFSRIGISAEISTIHRTVLREQIAAADFDAAIFSSHWSGHITQRGRRPGTGYQNAELGRLLEAEALNVDRDESDELMRDIWRIISDDLPVTFLHGEVSFSAAHRRVRGIQNNKPLIFDDLWIEDDDSEQNW
jgi:peptide/nickel transport system substrate-binding protein